MKAILYVLVSLLPSLILAQPGEKNFIDQNYIEVTGKAEMEVIPDQIYISVTISEKDTKNKTSLSELEQKMLESLKEIGIDISKDLLVIDIASNFKKYILSGTEILLSKEYQLLVHDGKTAGKVFIELEKIGISNINIEKLDHSKLEQYRKEVKVNAIQAAKEKAGSLARAIGQDVGRAIYIKEMDMYSGPVPRVANAAIAIRGLSERSEPEYKVPDIEFEKIKLEYSIICRFELK